MYDFCLKTPVEFASRDKNRGFDGGFGKACLRLFDFGKRNFLKNIERDDFQSQARSDFSQIR